MFKIERVEKEMWVNEFSKHAHISVFDKDESVNEHGCDYALIVTHEDSPVVYTTIKNAAPGCVVLEFGGSFPRFRGSRLVYPAYVSILEHLKRDHDAAFMIVRNDNKPMLKFALKSNFRVTGISFNAKGAPLLEHKLTFDKEMSHGC